MGFPLEVRRRLRPEPKYGFHRQRRPLSRATRRHFLAEEQNPPPDNADHGMEDEHIKWLEEGEDDPMEEPEHQMEEAVQVPKPEQVP